MRKKWAGVNKMAEKGKRTVGYIRASTEDQTITLDAQLDAIKLYIQTQHDFDGTLKHELATNLGLTNSHTENSKKIPGFYIDAGFSGGKVKGRRGYIQMMKDIKAGLIDFIVVMKLDRLHRNVGNILYFVEYCEDKVDIIFLDTRIDTSNAGGKMVLTVMAAMAQMELELIQERTRVALAAVKKEGRWVGRAPYGFRMAGLEEEDLNRVNGVLVPIDEEIKIVNQIFDYYLEGHSITNIVNKLGSKGNRKHKRWGFNSISKILGNFAVYTELLTLREKTDPEARTIADLIKFVEKYEKQMEREKLQRRERKKEAARRGHIELETDGNE